MDTQLVIGLSLILAGVTSAGIPWPQNFRATIATFFASGLGFGCEETSLYLYMLYLWGAECEPFMQALHFSFGVGASVAPLIAREFILPRNESNLHQWSPDDVQVHWCYEIIAICAMVVAVIFLCLYKFAPPSDEHPSRLTEETEETEDKNRPGGLQPTISMIQRESDRRRALVVKVICVFLLCIFCFFYCGIEVNFGAYLTPYAVDGPLKMTKSYGALIAAVYWAVFTFSRLITIFYIKLIGSRNNLILCCTILLAANVVLIPWSDNETCLWVGTFLVGLGASSVLASIFGFIEVSMKVTPLITSFTIASGCLGQSIFPIVTSQLFDADKLIFLWLTLGAAIAMSVFLVLIIICFNYYGKLMKERMESEAKRKIVVRPSYGRLNSIMSVASDTGKKKKRKESKRG